MDYKKISFKTRLTRINKIPKLDIENVSTDIGNYLAGYADGEGSFIITITKNKKRTNTFGVEVRPSFAVGQHNSRKEVLHLFKNTFGCGKVRKHYSKVYPNNMCYEVDKQGEILNRIIPFFDKYPIKSSKYKNFLVFKRICMMLENGDDFTERGIRKIIKLRSGMNYPISSNRIDDNLLLGIISGRRESA